MDQKACSICGCCAGNRTHIAREMMFGMAGTYSYLECARCGCLQLIDPPADMSPYYPRNYYSFATHGPLKQWLVNRRDDNTFGNRSVVGWLMGLHLGPNQALADIVRQAPLPTIRILDVGCGSGQLVKTLVRLGYSQVKGIDPHLEHDETFRGGGSVKKASLEDVSEKFDLIMLHHSFEHMADPGKVLRKLESLLNKGGGLMIRIPVAGAQAWRDYGCNWFHLDAPRHLYLHTRASLDLLAARAGLVVAEENHEADDTTYWGSELYASGENLAGSRSCLLHSWKKWLHPFKWYGYRRKAKRMNVARQADQRCFYLQRDGAHEA